MEAIGAASGIIAVIDISYKVILLFSQYSNAVAGAQSDINRLDSQVKALKTTLQHARGLIEGPRGGSLPASSELNSGEVNGQVEVCQALLRELQSRLEPRSSRKVMHRVGLRALKWPFTRKEVEKIASNLAKCQDNIMRGLQIDQTNLLLNISTGLEELSFQQAEKSVTATQQPTPTPTPKPKPKFMVPFTRDPFFVARPGIQDWVAELLSGPDQRVAIVGMGGFGKSQIAIELAHEINGSSKEPTSVFWVHGGTKEKLKESYHCIAETLELPGHSDAEVDILALVYKALQVEEKTRWFIILDNADEMDVFFDKTSPKPLASYLPKTANGKIFITSRSLNVSERLVSSHNAIKRIPPMDGSEALQLFRNKLGSEVDGDMAEELVHALDCIPLAVTQAAAYINRRSPRVTVGSYLESFRESDKKKTNLLSYDAGDIRRDETVSNSIAITWQVTFEQIQLERKTAINLLSLMSYFQPTNIHENLISRHVEHLMDVEANDIVNLSFLEEYEEFEDDLDTLRAYSLVSPSSRRKRYEMHPLVQFCTQRWLMSSGGDKYWTSLYLRLIARYFQCGDAQTRPLCQFLLPHAQPLLQCQPSDDRDILAWARLLYQTSRYFRSIGDYHQAEQNVKKSLEIRKQHLGLYHLDTINSKVNLALTYGNQGLDLQAEDLQTQVLEHYRERYGPNDVKTLNIMINLSSIYMRQDRLQEAKDFNTHVLEQLTAKFGNEYEDRLYCLQKQAQILANENKNDEAEKMCREAQEVTEKVLGLSHEGTAYGMGLLVSILIKQEKYDEAEQLLFKAIGVVTDIYGEDHIETLRSYNQMAAIWGRTNRIQEAETGVRELVGVAEKKLGRDHIFTQFLLSELSSYCFSLEKKQEAIELMEEVYRNHNARSGPDHWRTRESAEMLRKWASTGKEDETPAQ